MADTKMAILTTAATVALGLVAVNAHANPYVAGDMHNHNTCTDGSVSVGYSIDRAVGTGTAATGGNNFGLDWFTIGNHGGSGNRDCRFSDPSYDSANTLGSAENGTATNADGTPRATLWTDTFGQTIQGTTVNSLLGTPNGNNMWRWQNIQQVEYPIVAAHATGYNKTIIEGLEWIAPGHEHIDMAVITGQFPKAGTPNADAVAEFEFRFDRADNDAIGPVDASGNTLWMGKDNTDNSGTAGHQKAVQGVAWLQTHYPVTSYAVPTHTERQGPFDPNGTKGFNIEHFRDFNNAGPTVAFGIESPGHMSQGSVGGGAGSYGTGAVGGGTYGFEGVYTAKVGGLWDGLLAEGRNMFIYVSSDWHNRGIFPASSLSTTSDFQPGEFTKLYVPAKTDGTTVNGMTAQDVVNGIRSGNSYSVSGGLIGSNLLVQARVGTGKAVGMGGTLVVNPGDVINYVVRVTLPAHNNSPYSFNNPLLLQDGIKQPLNQPVLDHIDLITGNITGLIGPGQPGYAVANASGVAGANIVYNPSATIAKQLPVRKARTLVLPDSSVQLTFTTTFVAPSTPFYIRLRGTNVPVATPNVTDAAGNPLLDVNNALVPCSDPACPAHLDVVNGTKMVTYDVQAYSNLWFYGNPIFVRPATYPQLLVEKNAALAANIILHGGAK
jgi:hypothetical protein